MESKLRATFFLGFCALLLLGAPALQCTVLYSFQSPSLPSTPPSGLAFGPIQFDYFADDFITTALPPSIPGSSLADQFTTNGPIALVSLIPGPVYSPDVAIYFTNYLGGYTGVSFLFSPSDPFDHYGTFYSVAGPYSASGAILTISAVAPSPSAMPEPQALGSTALGLGLSVLFYIRRRAKHANLH